MGSKVYTECGTPEITIGIKALNNLKNPSIGDPLALLAFV